MLLKVMLFASNDHLELQQDINLWLTRARPAVQSVTFVADGAEYTYCVMIMYLAPV